MYKYYNNQLHETNTMLYACESKFGGLSLFNGPLDFYSKNKFSGSIDLREAQGNFPYHDWSQFPLILETIYNFHPINWYDYI